MLLSQGTLLRIIPVFGILVVILLYNELPGLFRSSEPSSRLHPANATLGFGALLAVSGADSPRRARLLQAANVTDIDLTIPDQPRWTDEEREALKEKAGDKGVGSMLAWLAHITVLKSFLDSGLETALILEDDVDWDIHLRTIQAPVVSAGVRSLLDIHARLNAASKPEYYYGNPADWDLLYMGHCGDYFGPADDTIGVDRPALEDLTKSPYTLTYDVSLPDREDLHPFTARFLGALKIPEKTRVIHPSQYPLCTFAYAVTRASANRIVNELALPFEETDISAFDVKILHACRDRGLRCYSINPELFHHMDGQSWIQQVEEADVGKPPVDASGYEQVMQRKESSNIGCGFFSKEFYFDEDLIKLEYLRKEVGKNGRCLKQGRDHSTLEIDVWNESKVKLSSPRVSHSTEKDHV